jgi:ubiquinone/menaquinone biosynthesis C-methylase UbiE
MSDLRLPLQTPFARKDESVTYSLPEIYWVKRKFNIVGRASLDKLRQGEQSAVYEAISHVITSNSYSHLLDLGCNFGVLRIFLRDKGYRGKYVGVDRNPYSLSLASRPLAGDSDCSSELICANIRSLPFRSQSTPCIVIKDVLEHMEDFRPILSEVFRVASKSVIVANFIPWTEGKPIIRQEPEGYYHNMYNRRNVYDFAGETGFSVEAVLSVLDISARANEIVVFMRS